MFFPQQHKIIRNHPPLIPKDRNAWPRSWKEVEFKSYQRFKQITLPKDLISLGTFESALQNRHSSYKFDQYKSISLTKISTALYYSFGIKGLIGEENLLSTTNLKNSRRHYPSAGARYPLEVYLIVNRVESIDPGIYHYYLPAHSLEQLRVFDDNEDVSSILKLNHLNKPAVSFVISSIQERNERKYGDWGYDMTLLEAGQATQNLHLCLSNLEIGFFPYIAFDYTEMSSLLKLSEGELLLYSTVAGIKT